MYKILAKRVPIFTWRKRLVLNLQTELQAKNPFYCSEESPYTLFHKIGNILKGKKNENRKLKHKYSNNFTTPASIHQNKNINSRERKKTGTVSRTSTNVQLYQ